LEKATAVDWVVVVIMSNKFCQSILPAFTSAYSAAGEKFPGITQVGKKSSGYEKNDDIHFDRTLGACYRA
jgi:hypothetical protein